MSAPRLDIFLQGDMLSSARDGRFRFMRLVRAAVEERGWRVTWRDRDAGPVNASGHVLTHMERPPPGGLCFRRTYYYPFWHIEPRAERWRWPVAQARYDPDLVEGEKAKRFATNLRRRVLASGGEQRGDDVLIALQGRLRVQRSFQTMSPLDMVAVTAATGRPCIATLHPREQYDTADHDALAALVARYPNLKIGSDSAALLPECAFVVTQNSAVAMDGYLLGKPAVLFAQADFHHIALNVAELGAESALSLAARHRPDTARYLFWFLRQNAIEASAPDARNQIRVAMRKGGWSI